MSWITCLLVMLGGALGTLARYLLSLLLAPLSRGLPVGTISINVIGSFIIGFFGALTLEHGRFAVAANTRLFVMVGLCGGFTTFSSFSLQTFDLLRSGATLRASVNIFASVLLCVCATAMGQFIAGTLNGGGAPATQAVAEEPGLRQGRPSV